MAKVLFKRIEDSSLIDNYDIEDGSFWVTGDGKTFIDYNGERISIAGTPDTEINDRSHNTVENKVIKSYVDDSINNAKSEVNGQILWQNQNPTTTFESQDVTLSSTDYDVLEIYYYDFIGTKRMQSTKLIKGNDGIMQSIFENNDKGYIGYRKIYYRSNSLYRFGSAVSIVQQDAFQRLAVNDWLVPVYIVGYKTGLF